MDTNSPQPRQTDHGDLDIDALLRGPDFLAAMAEFVRTSALELLRRTIPGLATGQREALFSNTQVRKALTHALRHPGPYRAKLARHAEKMIRAIHQNPASPEVTSFLALEFTYETKRYLRDRGIQTMPHLLHHAQEHCTPAATQSHDFMALLEIQTVLRENGREVGEPLCPSRDDVLQWDVHRLDLSTRASNAIHWAFGPTSLTIGQLIQKPITEFSLHEKVGETSVKEVLKKLSLVGVQWGASQ